MMDQVLFHVILICVLLLVFRVRITLGVGAEIGGARGRASGTWCYEEDDCRQGDSSSDWEKSTCANGQEQSPINLPGNLGPSTDAEKVKCSTLDLSRSVSKYKFNDYYMTNAGYSIYVYPDEASNPEFKYGPGTFKFHQFHFHWGPRNDLGSEHAISGHSYPMELHLVHFDKEYKKLGDAVGKGLAVLGFMLEIDPSSSGSFLQPIVNAITSNGLKTTIDNKVDLTDEIDLSGLIEGQTEAYHYDGSLTTPAGDASCAEKVKWFVFRKPIAISEDEMKVFREVTRDGTNKALFTYRALQKLHDRKVQVIKVKT